MNPAAVRKAKIRLIAARAAVRDLDYASPADDFHAAWYTFLTAAKNIYTQLSKGALGAPRSMQWIGGKNTERRDDPLLQYIFQARDDDEHGNGLVLDTVEPMHEFGENDAGSHAEYLVDPATGRHFTRLHVKSSDGKPVHIKARVRHMRLRAVTGRGPRVYQPPKEHLGRPLESDWPHWVAQLALAYLEQLVADAEAMAS